MKKKSLLDTLIKLILNLIALFILIALVTQLPTKIADKLFYLKNRKKVYYGEQEI